MNETVLCGASGYEKKYYLNPMFASLPEGVRNELKILCVLYTEEFGGTLTLSFDKKGSLLLQTQYAEDDYGFDEIGSQMKIRQIQREKAELLQALELYYKVFVLKQGMGAKS